jgi:hypothetical protein
MGWILTVSKYLQYLFVIRFFLPAAILRDPIHTLFRGEEGYEVEPGGSQLACFSSVRNFLWSTVP